MHHWQGRLVHSTSRQPARERESHILLDNREVLGDEFAAPMEMREHFSYKVVRRRGARRHANSRAAGQPFVSDVTNRFDKVGPRARPLGNFDQPIRVGAVSRTHDKNHLRPSGNHLDRVLSILRRVTDVLIPCSDERRKARSQTVDHVPSVVDAQSRLCQIGNALGIGRYDGLDLFNRRDKLNGTRRRRGTPRPRRGRVSDEDDP